MAFPPIRRAAMRRLHFPTRTGTGLLPLAPALRGFPCRQSRRPAIPSSTRCRRSFPHATHLPYHTKKALSTPEKKVLIIPDSENCYTFPRRRGKVAKVLTEYQARRLEKGDRVDVCLADFMNVQLTQNGRLCFGGQVALIKNGERLEYVLYGNTGRKIACSDDTSRYLATTVLSADCDGVLVQFDPTRESVMLSYLEAAACMSLY